MTDEHEQELQDIIGQYLGRFTEGSEDARLDISAYHDRLEERLYDLVAKIEHEAWTQGESV